MDAFASLPVVPKVVPRALRPAVLRIAASTLGRTYLARDRSLLERRHGGRHWAALEGLAVGAGLTPTAVYGMNAFEIESALPAIRLGCTALALPASRTSAGRPWLGYNHDFPPAFEPYLRLRVTRPSAGFASLNLAYLLTVGAVAGLNQAGLALTLNQAFATDVDRRAPALLSTLLVQEALDTCVRVDDVLELARRTRVACGALFTAVDATGARAVIELSGTRCAVRTEAPGRLLHAFNRYERATLRAVEVPLGAVTTGAAAGYSIHECNVLRERRFAALVQHDRDHTLADVQALLADHDGHAGSMNTICCHGDELNHTIASIVLDPVARRIHHALGPACTARYVTRELSVDAASAAFAAAC